MKTTYIRATAVLSAIVCGLSVLTFVPTALAAQFDRFDNANYQMCINGETVIVKGYNVNRQLARGGTLGACYQN